MNKIDEKNKSKIIKLKNDVKQKKLKNAEKKLVDIADAYLNKYINEEEYNESVSNNLVELSLIKKKLEVSDIKVVKFEKMNFVEKRAVLLDMVKYITIDMYTKSQINICYKKKN